MKNKSVINFIAISIIFLTMIFVFVGMYKLSQVEVGNVKCWWTTSNGFQCGGLIGGK